MTIRRIPLFPLNVVLFPGMLLPLHIFEPRYQQMIRHCLEGDHTFGVCLIRSGEEVGGTAEPHPVGSTCEILSVTKLEEGRMNLSTVGRERFRVRQLFHTDPYLEAEVELLPVPEGYDLSELVAEVREATMDYVAALLSLPSGETASVELPTEPLELSNLVGAVLQAPLSLRQELLETDALRPRLERELELLRAETGRLPNAGPAAPPLVVRRLRVNRDDFSLN